MAHVSQTDHRVVRTHNVVSLKETGGDADALAFVADSAAGLAPWERDRALGLAAWMHLLKTGRQPPVEVAQILARVLEQVPDDGAVLMALGSMANAGRRIDLARRYFERARFIPATEEAALLDLADIFYLSSDHENCLNCLDRLLALDLGSAKIHALKADVLATIGKRREGIDEALRALDLNPTLIPVREWLARMYADSDHEHERRAQEQILSRMRAARPPR